MKVVFLTVHNATSSRKVDFHFWADVIGRQYDVDFVTVGFSFLTQLKQRGKSYTPPYNQWIVTFASEQYKRRKYLWRAPVHPMRTGSAYTDKLFDKIFSFYPALMPKNLLDSLATMTVCVVENGAGLLLVPYLKQLYPHVHFVYWSAPYK